MIPLERVALDVADQGGRHLAGAGSQGLIARQAAVGHDRRPGADGITFAVGAPDADRNDRASSHPGKNRRGHGKGDGSAGQADGQGSPADGPVNEHRRKPAGRDRLRRAQGRKCVVAELDRLCSPPGPVIGPPPAQAGGRLRIGHDAHRDSHPGEGERPELKKPKVPGGEDRSGLERREASFDVGELVRLLLGFAGEPEIIGEGDGKIPEHAGRVRRSARVAKQGEVLGDDPDDVRVGCAVSGRQAGRDCRAGAAADQRGHAGKRRKDLGGIAEPVREAGRMRRGGRAGRTAHEKSARLRQKRAPLTRHPFLWG